MIALGIEVGPLVGGAFSQQATWRWTFWLVVPLAALAAGIVWLLLPKTNVAGDWKVKVSQIDSRGILTSMAAIIPISGGWSSTYKWNSTLVIVMLTIGGILAIVFVLVEWKSSPMPLMPRRLFRKRDAKILLGNNFLMGILYFTDLSFIPLFFQNVRGYSPLLLGFMILPLIVGFSIGSSASGILISRIEITNPIIRTGLVM
ncbi:hypothetical protein BGX38DRAFT_1272943 [Terfezia claveryi]|nr:hypothetical protein BGX38DRAFT_1272943 [Terfezia claveryi]